MLLQEVLMQNKFAKLKEQYRRLLAQESELLLRVRLLMNASVERRIAGLRRNPGFAHFAELTAWEVEIDPTELQVGIMFFIKRRYPLKKNGNDRRDLERAQALYTDMDMDLIRPLREEFGIHIGYDVTVG